MLSVISWEGVQNRGPEFFGGGKIDTPVTEIPLFKHSLPLIRQSVKAVVDDSFNRCFENAPTERWNWGHLFVPYCFGVVIRYFVLFPLRLCILLTGVLVLLVMFFCVKVSVRAHGFVHDPCMMSQRMYDVTFRSCCPCHDPRKPPWNESAHFSSTHCFVLLSRVPHPRVVGLQDYPVDLWHVCVVMEWRD
jgi:hypothetical protein